MYLHYSNSPLYSKEINQVYKNVFIGTFTTLFFIYKFGNDVFKWNVGQYLKLGRAGFWQSKVISSHPYY